MENICVKQPLERKYQGKIRLDYHHRLEKVGGEMVVHRCKALQTIPFATHCSDCISYGKTLHRVTINFHDGFQRLASAVRGNYWARRKMCPVVRRTIPSCPSSRVAVSAFWNLAKLWIPARIWRYSAYTIQHGVLFNTSNWNFNCSFHVQAVYLSNFSVSLKIFCKEKWLVETFSIWVYFL